jgi:hypothetical protein
MIASKELHRRRQCHSQGVAITARKLADFLQSVEADELLMTQRLRDQEAHATRSAPGAIRPATPDSDKFRVDPAEDNDMVSNADCADAGEIYGEF